MVLRHKKITSLRVFQKKFKLLLQPGQFSYMILALNKLMKFFLAQYTSSYRGSESAWLACFQSGTWASWADLEPPSEAVYLAAILDF